MRSMLTSAAPSLEQPTTTAVSALASEPEARASVIIVNYNAGASLKRCLRSLLSDLLPMQSIRAAGLHLIGSIGALRRLAMREGLAPSWRTRPTFKETPADPSREATSHSSS